MAAYPPYIVTSVTYGSGVSNVPTPHPVGSFAWVSLADGRVQVAIGHGQPQGTPQQGSDDPIMIAMRKADPTCEIYYHRYDEHYWKMLHAPDKLEAVVQTWVRGGMSLTHCIFHAREGAAAAECVICHYATASVSDRCRYCAGQMPAGWEL